MEVFLAATAWLSVSADPTGLKKALELADQAEVYYVRTASSKIVKEVDLKNLAVLVDFKEDVELVPKDQVLATKEFFEIHVKKDATIQSFVLFGGEKLSFKDGEVWKRAHCSNPKLGNALRGLFSFPPYESSAPP